MEQKVNISGKKGVRTISGKERAERKQQVLKLYKEGLPAKAIAYEMERSTSLIYSIIAELKEEGKIVEIEGKKVGIYKDEKGNLHAVNPICSHLGCEVIWNSSDKTWDCPCHGSRFDYSGKSIYSPSIKDIENLKINN